jgi:hypothetical protein
VLWCGVLCCYAVAAASTHGQGYVWNLFFSLQNARARALKLPPTRTRTQVISLLVSLAHALPGSSSGTHHCTAPSVIACMSYEEEDTCAMHGAERHHEHEHARVEQKRQLLSWLSGSREDVAPKTLNLKP